MKRFGILISVLVLTAAAGLFILPKEDFSENENKRLQSFPELSLKSLEKGDFTKELSDYISDHFPLRGVFLNINSFFQKNVLGMDEINGVYVAEDGYFIEKYEKPENTENIEKIINNFCRKTEGARVYMGLVPTAVTLYENKLPKFAPKGEQLRVLGKIYENTDTQNIDIYDALKDSSDGRKLFYKLDHHWTTGAAYTAYRKIAEEMGFSPTSEEDFDIETVTEDFKGTIYSKVNLYGVEGEEIEAYFSEDDIDVYYEDTGEESDSLYNRDYLDKKDKYSFFLNNIHTLITIENKNSDTERELAVIKDSYANCLIPFLVKHFSKIYVFDTRYYKGAVSDFVNERGISDVLFLYNMNTIDKDLGIRTVY